MMKSFGFAAVAALFLASGAQAASFTYAATFDNGSAATNVITGSFDGDLNGNLITNLSKITAIFNGVAFNGSGTLFGSHYVAGRGFVSGGAVASLDGAQNNFLFIDSDYPNSNTFSNYYYSLLGTGSGGYGDYVGTSNNGSASNQAARTTFTATEVAAVPEPASWAMFIGGFGLVGGALRRRRTTVAFA